MNKNKWFLNGGRGSGKSIRLLCETYENKIVELQNKVDTLQGFLDHDIEYDMDKTIQEQKIKIAELENENKVLTQNLEDTEIINAELKEQIKHLETSVSNLRKDNKELQKVLPKLDKENDELKYKISLLLSCKDCPENKGGLICSKEYNDKCLAQNLEDTEIINNALEKENAELKERVETLEYRCENIKDTDTMELVALQKENAELKAELSENKVADCHIVNGLCEQLTNAKEIIKQLMKAIPYGSGKLATEAYDKAEQFLKETK